MENIKQILVLSNRLEMSGGEYVLERTLKSLIKHYHFTILSPDPILLERFQRFGCQAYSSKSLSPLSHKPNPLLIRSAYGYVHSLFEIHSVCKKNNIQLIIGNGIGTFLQAALFTFLARIPAIGIHHHPVNIKKKYLRLGIKFAELLGLKIICVSKALREGLINAGIWTGNLVTIHNGLDLSEYKPQRMTALQGTREIFGVREDSHIILFPAVIEEWKGQHLIIKALHILKMQNKMSAKTVCIFAGNIYENSLIGKEYKQRLLDMIQSYNLENNFNFVGKLTDMPCAYSAADIVVSASIDPEPFGTVLYEAMAMEKLVIAPRHGGNPEIINDRINGFLFEPGNPHELASLISECLYSRNGFAEIRLAARKKVESKFSIVKTAQLYHDYINKHL